MLAHKADAYVQENDAVIRKYTTPATPGAVDLPEFQKAVEDDKAGFEQRELTIEQELEH